MPSAVEIHKDLAGFVLEAMQIAQRGFRAELVGQGHRLTGRLAESIVYEVGYDASGAHGEMLADNYAVYVDAGIQPQNVRYPIQVMISYWRKRGLGEREAVRAAWATRAKHKREGMPTRSSYAFAKNGRRSGFIKHGIAGAIEEIRTLFQDKTGEMVEVFYLEMARGLDDRVVVEI